MTPDEIAAGIDDVDKLAQEGQAVLATVIWHPEHIPSVEPHENIAETALNLMQSSGYEAHSDDRNLISRKYGVFLKASWQLELPKDDIDEFIAEGGHVEVGHLYEAPWIRVEIDVEDNTDYYRENDDVEDMREDVERVVGIDDVDELGTLADALNAAHVKPVETDNRKIRLYVDSWTRVGSSADMPISDMTDRLVYELGITNMFKGFYKDLDIDLQDPYSSVTGDWVFWAETEDDKAFYYEGEWYS